MHRLPVVYNTDHTQHQAAYEFFRGQRVPAFETPIRIEQVRLALDAAHLAEWLPCQDFADIHIEAVHSPRYLCFLREAHAEYRRLGGTEDAFPSVWSIRGMRSDIEPENFAARMGLYSFDSGTPLTAGAWQAARRGADCALTAATQLVSAARSAFCLTRPPGHHAGPDFFGGYCFINQAAVAAHWLCQALQGPVAILDVDYHHGNGTQAIFYERSDVLFVSIHADPRTDYPFFLGHADEQGRGPGEGYNLNLPLPQGIKAEAWFAALERAIKRIEAHAPVALVVSLGLDTYEGDPISHFGLRTHEDYPRLGERIARLALPTLWIMEGGYASEALGANVVAVLGAYLAASR